MPARRRTLALWTLALLWATPIVAQPPEPVVPADKQAHVLVRTLAFDRALPARAGQTVGVGVVFAAKDDTPPSQQEIRTAFERMNGLEVLGRTVQVSVHTFTDVRTLGRWMQDNGIDAVYLAHGLRSELEDIRSVCSEQKVASLAGGREFVEQGVAIGVVPRGQGVRIVVNLEAAAKAGMDLDAKLLELAEVLPAPAARE